MLVVSDTSPITNLIQIGQIDLLKNLFTQVIIPQTVYEELSELPQQKLIVDTKPWLSVRAAQRQDRLKASLKN